MPFDRGPVHGEDFDGDFDTRSRIRPGGTRPAVRGERAARGGLISINDPSLPASTDGFNLTRDTSTGLEWLDVAASADYSFQTIQGQFARAVRFRASVTRRTSSSWGETPRGQVESLFKSAGLGGTIVFSFENYELVRGLMGYVGFSGNTGEFGYAYGTLVSADDPSTPLDGKIEALFSQGYDTGESGISSFDTFVPRRINTTDVGLPAVRGNWLVRPAASAVPSRLASGSP